MPQGRLSEFQLKTDVLLDEVRAGGGFLSLLGVVSPHVRESLGLPIQMCFACPNHLPLGNSAGYTLGQKMVGRACGMEGFALGSIVSPHDNSGITRHNRSNDP